MAKTMAEVREFLAPEIKVAKEVGYKLTDNDLRQMAKRKQHLENAYREVARNIERTRDIAAADLATHVGPC